MRRAKTSLTGVALLLAGCGAPTDDAFVELATPAGAGSVAPRLDLGADGVARMSWIEPRADGGHALYLSAFEDEGWGTPREVASGDAWFVNWADVPALAALADGTLLAAWLDRLGEGTYAYGVRVARSHDGGASWTPGELLHEDDSPTEHGFVSLAALDADTFAAVWLDGRATGASGGGHHGEMQLRARTLDRAGRLGPERLLDERVCDCCPTALVRVGADLLAAYRDRDPDERRDVSLVAFGARSEAEPRAFHADGWTIDGCPVNGPVLAAAGPRVGAAWYTEAGGTPRVLAALSSDGGASFGASRELAGAAAFGSVGAAFARDGALWVSWLEDEPEGLAGAWVLARVDPSGTSHEERHRLRAPFGRTAGVARLIARDDGLLFAWVDVDGDDAPRVRTARLAATP